MSGWIAALPKAELHVHLEGAISPATLLTLAERHGVDLPATDLDGLRSWFRFRDFPHFVEIYLTCSKCLRDPEDFLLIAEEFIREQKRQNVLYTEAHFTIGTHIQNGLDPSEILDALDQAVAWGREQGVELRFIFDILRNVPEMADATLEWALEGRSRELVVAVGLSGFEDHPTAPLADHYAEAERQGLHRTAHAGEHAGPESIYAALEYARAERIGHGISAAQDTSLQAELAKTGVLLEICPSSNVQLHAVEDYASHPFRDLDNAGIQVTVNSDDPWLFDVSLTDEYGVLAERFGYGSEDLRRIARNAFAGSFAPDDERTRLLAAFESFIEDAPEGDAADGVEPAFR